MSDKEDIERNRRESFRIDDTVTLGIRPLDRQSLESICADFNAYRLRFCMKSHLQNHHVVKRPKLTRIRKSNPEIAEYLESLEMQIGTLAERLDQLNDSTDNSKKISGLVNLSSSGIRFRTELPLLKGQMIEVGMALSTLNSQVVMLGKVVRVESRPKNMLAVSIRYTHIHPEDKEAVVRHMARLQQLELQGRNRTG